MKKRKIPGKSDKRAATDPVRKLPNRRGKRTIIGLVQFDSGVADLASNPDYMEDLGRDSLPQSNREH